MVDWTTVATAAIAGGTGLLTGVVAARFQVKTSSSQQRTQLELLELQQAEAFRTARREVYREFLEAERAFQTLVFSAQQLNRAIYAEWQETFDRAFVNVQLLATMKVREEVERFADTFPRKLRVPRTADAEADSRAIRSGYAELLPAIRKARSGIIDAMRRDVAGETRDGASAYTKGSPEDALGGEAVTLGDVG
jgi:uncharacterized membrane-anchored protein YhcB (DUF1043 family)